MPNRPARHTPYEQRNRLDPDGNCTQCGQRHLTGHGHVACAGHVTKARADADGYRAPLPEPRPCHNPRMTGQAVCRNHGGQAAQSRAAGERRVSEQNVRALAARWAVPVDTTPTEAILGRVAAFAGHVQFYREQLEQLEPNDLVWGVTKETEGDVVVPGVGLDRSEGQVREAKPNAWLTLYNEASETLVKFAAEALKAGIEERRVRLAEAQGQLVAEVLRAVAARLNLTPEQAAEFAKAAPEELRRLYAA